VSAGLGPAPHPLYLVTLWCQGASVVFPLYKHVLLGIGAKGGDQVLCRVHPPYVTFRVAHFDRIIPAEAFTLDELPPATLPLHTRETRR
jgi:hypothetical protein